MTGKPQIQAGPFALVLFGALFCIALPGFLALLTAGLGHLPLPPLPLPPAIGWPLTAAGLTLMVLATTALVRHGKGLPMSLSPPGKFVSRGIYVWVAHPIYLGAWLFALGIALAAGSAAGVYIVVPLFALMIGSYVFGFEGPGLDRHFGKDRQRPIFALPAGGPGTPRVIERFAAAAWAFLPWALGYQYVVRLLDMPQSWLDPALPGEATMAVWPIFALPYAASYGFIALAPAIAPTRTALREFVLMALLASALVLPLYLLLPLHAPFREVGEGWLAALIRFEQSHDGPTAALPAFHVIWTWIALRLYTAGRSYWRWLAYGFAALIVAACWATGLHRLADLAAAAVVCVALEYRHALWRVILRVCEKIANAWAEWRLGRLRILSHAVPTFIAASSGLFVSLNLVDNWPARGALVMTALAAVVTAGIWGNLVTGSARLQRPFGYFGALAGGFAGLFLFSTLTGAGFWSTAAAAATGGALAQGLGRLRCLIQGCCHGRVCAKPWGITYHTDKSRVAAIAGLKGRSVVPTQAYSLVGNLFLFLAQLRLIALGAPASFVVAVFLVGNAAARFVEEAYRGEPQTPVYKGLKLYQWLALGQFLLGCLIAMTDSGPASLPSTGLGDWILITAISFTFAAVASIAYSIDLPEGKVRWSRLTPT